jgi:HEXXH motif-containing protein
MTTNPVTGVAPRDVAAVHATIAPATALVPERRTLYQLAAELLEPRIGALDLDVLDSPVARGHIGRALAGQERLSRAELVGISAMAGESAAAATPRVASLPTANTLLAGPLQIVAAELGRQHTASGSLQLLTEADGERFASALAVLIEGIALVRSVSPGLIDDLLAHVALVGIFDPQREGRLVSASCRTYPGLILLETPSSIDVAEALVHEAAHQKLFDFAITHDLLTVDSDRCPPFHPPWAPDERLWPLEQTLAACHAYACLAQFSQQAGVPVGRRAVGDHSLLPVAHERCTVTGQWLLDMTDHLGADAQMLLERLLSQPLPTARIAASPAILTADYAAIDPALEFRRCDSVDRVLVGCPSQPPQLYWIGEDAASLLQVLGRRPIDDVIDTFARWWRVPHCDASDRLAALLFQLSESGLVTTVPKCTAW